MPYKSDLQIIEEFEAKFVHKGEDGDDPSERWAWTIAGSFPIEVESFILALRKNDREAIREWAEKNASTGEWNRNLFLSDLLTFLNSLEK